jgi:hypothetical protein
MEISDMKTYEKKNNNNNNNNNKGEYEKIKSNSFIIEKNQINLNGNSKGNNNNNNNLNYNESISDITMNSSIISDYNNNNISINSKINSYRNAILSDYVKTLKIGYLMPIDCGHNGSYTQNEFNLYYFYLLNSNLIN